MAQIKPFKAIRPTRDKANLIASRPFYTYKKNVLGAKLESNKYSFLHVINPEFNKKDRTQPNSIERFEKVREKYEEFIEKGYFLKEKEACYYLYRQQTGEDDFLGIICGVSAEEYRQGKIKVHEHTLTQREETFKLYLDVCKFNAEPVLLTHPDHPEIEKFYQRKIQERSEYEFTTTDSIKHDLWLINDPYELSLIEQYFSEIDAFYIADGHHRSASSVRFADAHKDNTLAQYFLAFLIAESGMRIYEYNRIIKDLNGLTKSDFLTRLSHQFVLTPLVTPIKPQQQHQFLMILFQEYYLLTPKEGIVNEEHPIQSLDTQLLMDAILTPILGIKDPKSDPRLTFIEGTKEIKDVQKSMKTQGAEVAFLLFPVTTNQLKRVADTHNIMPPKSTWVEPKLRSGLTVYEYIDTIIG
jgi:uncharacterized protein (DUF1015 family)